ncbi:MAG: DUF1295 domain-containing protein [Candidatus Lokiarchaeota archaeon]|nr:DUF1295 domain-containing protein [Candidatus Lokiarchaeota archaeon]MBD3202414.1 DUF1295 domain-containing protein [Candidatus Lokiarchaeota archaeon]
MNKEKEVNNQGNSSYKIKFSNFAVSISSILLPIFQYIPTASIWFGIMSVPFFSYLLIFFSNPNIIGYDISFFFSYGYPWSIIIIFGVFFFIFSFTYQVIHRKALIQKGPYRFVRHPQYLSFILITLSLTMISLRTAPVHPFGVISINYDVIVLIWMVQTLVYILLAKIEEYSLRKKFGEKFEKYKKAVGFMIPKLKINQLYNKKAEEEMVMDLDIIEKETFSFISKIKDRVLSFFISIAAGLILLFQYVPTASFWLGLMSMPLILYLTAFFSIYSALSDFNIFFWGLGYPPWSQLTSVAIIFTTYSFIFQLINRKELIKKGPYKIVRHPQYLGLIVITFSLTMISLNASPISPISGHEIILLTWIIESFVYMFLAKIEEFSLWKRFGKKFENYRKTVGFMFPSFISEINKTDQN